MWDYIQDDLTSIVFVSKKDKSLTIKIYGFDDNETAETFAAVFGHSCKISAAVHLLLNQEEVLACSANRQRYDAMH